MLNYFRSRARFKRDRLIDKSFKDIEYNFGVKHGDIPSLDALVEISYRSIKAYIFTNGVIFVMLGIEFSLAALNFWRGDFLDGLAPAVFGASLVMILYGNKRSHRGQVESNAMMIGMMCAVHRMTTRNKETVADIDSKLDALLEENARLTIENEQLREQLKACNERG